MNFLEQKAMYKRMLFQLLAAEKSQEELKKMIIQVEVEMDKEDVSYVKEKINEMFNEKGEL